MIGIIEKEIISKNYLGDRGKNRWFANKLIDAAISGLINKQLSNYGRFRSQIEIFAQNEKFMEMISFEVFNIRDPLDTSKFFKLKITKDDLIGADFSILGTIKVSDQIFDRIKETLTSRSMDDSIELLIDIIRNKENGVAKIIPVISSSDIRQGYQYLIPSNDPEALIHKYEPYLPKDFYHPYWVIDLNNDEKSGRETLRNIIMLMLNKDYAFVMKNKDGDFEDGLATCIFDRNGFFNIQDFYSGSYGQGGSGLVKYHFNYQMILDSFYPNFDIGEFNQWNSRWDAMWEIISRYNRNDLMKYL
ncbi:hypothetical protein LCGC14_2425650 [marine sediment metagenome]|uniref:Uncharacterized protein n=1 Tax=marine sediment metagenome TaxID=412755 RepID=A0A0F9E0H6_9ZZZZ